MWNLVEVCISLAPVFRDVGKVAMEMHMWGARAGNLEMLPLPEATEASHLVEEVTPPPFQNRDLTTLSCLHLHLISCLLGAEDNFWIPSSSNSLFTFGCFMAEEA